MALLPPRFMNAVAALGVSEGDGPVTYNATGFLYGHPTGAVNGEGSPTYSPVLVTNRHVLEGARERKEMLHVRFNTLTGSSVKSYHINPGAVGWVLHSDPDADVAVIGANSALLLEDGIDFAFIEGDTHTLSFEEARSGLLSEGDPAFVLGFPFSLVGQEELNYVIVRQGVVARAQHWLNGSSRTFLLDAWVFPGNSGGPVFSKPEVSAIEGTKHNDRCLLIGMVSSYLPYREIAVSAQTNRPRMISEENSGLVEIVPVKVIQESHPKGIEAGISVE